MFNKLRRKSKDQASPLATATPSHPKHHDLDDSTRKPITFYDLPAELRIKVYELVASETKLSLFSNSPKPQPPSLLFVTRQIRAEYRPILLSLAPVQAHIYDYDFSPLIRLIGSLYSTELKALRTNNSLIISVHLTDYEVTKRDNMTLLRRWAVKRSEHLDRLPWSYELAVDPPGGIFYPAARERLRRLGQSILAVEVLQSGLHESLAAELRPVWEALHAREWEWDAAKTAAWLASGIPRDTRGVWVE
jgi:hypothetical protein